MYRGATILQFLADPMNTGVAVQMSSPISSILFLPTLSIKKPTGIISAVVARLEREMTKLISISEAPWLSRKRGKRGRISWIETTPTQPVASNSQRFLSSFISDKPLFALTCELQQIRIPCARCQCINIPIFFLETI